MSELGELYKDWKEFKKEQLRKNYADNLERRKNHKNIIEFTPYHWRIDGQVDFYPTKNRATYRGRNIFFNGNLDEVVVKYLETKEG